ncbi:MAG: hypothetical protein QM778_12555 [Myxococcales bacterium]
MPESLDAELDTLFQLPPAEMVEARNALVERLRKSGDKPGAQRIKALKRPAPAAWALNQVHFQRPELLDKALAQAAQMREMHAQDRVDPKELWALANAQRAATHAVVEAALGFCAASGLPHAQVQQRRILATVQGWLSGTGQEPPGRMTLELEAGGFDAVTEVGTSAPREPVERPSLPKAARSGTAAPDREAEALALARTALSTAERALEEAVESSATREREQEAAQAELGKTKADLQEAERALSALRFQLKQCNDNLVRSKEAHDRAQIVQRTAEATRARAQEALEKLERQRG